MKTNIEYALGFIIIIAISVGFGFAMAKAGAPQQQWLFCHVLKWCYSPMIQKD